MALGFGTFISPSVSGRPTQVGVVLWRGSIGAAGAWHLSLPLPYTLLIAPASKLTPVAISGHYGFPCFDFIPSRLPPGPTAPITLSSTRRRLVYRGSLEVFCWVGCQYCIIMLTSTVRHFICLSAWPLSVDPSSWNLELSKEKTVQHTFVDWLIHKWNG